MSDERATHAEREADGWAAFAAAVEAIPRARWGEVGPLPDWSVNELLWHVAGWFRDCAGHLREMRAGTFEDFEEDDAVTDARNAAFAAEARGLGADAIWAGVLEARAHVLGRWDELPAVDAVAIDWFAGETYRHYREHLPALRRFAR